MNKHSNKFIFIDNDTVKFSKQCMHCEGFTDFTITMDQYVSWIVDDGYIQEVFPEMSKEDREVMISGTHPKCWEDMFSVMEDDEYDDIDYSQFSDEELGFDKE